MFGSLQMLPDAASGGANVLPQSVCAAVFVVKVFLQPGNLVRGMEAAVDLRRVGLFTVFLIFSLLTALVLPRLFNGQIEVVPVSYVSGTSLVAPSSANVTQSGYMTISFATTLAFSILGSRGAFQKHFFMALLAGGVALILTGLLDLVTYYAGLSRLLDPFRNVSYSLLTDVEAIGAKRVVGLTPEASVYGSLCVNAATALIFLRPLYPPRFRRVIVPLVIASLLIMIMICTSSSAYIGLSVLCAAYAVNLAIRFRSFDPVAREGLQWEIVIMAGLGLGLFALVVLAPRMLDPVRDMIDTMVFQKTSSSSYLERSMWNRVGMQAFVDTGGLGVGLGSIRTSNWFVSIPASTGIFGALLMFGFLLKVMATGAGSVSGHTGDVRRAIRFSMVPLFVMYSLGGTIPDIGLLAASYFGLLTAE